MYESSMHKWICTENIVKCNNIDIISQGRIQEITGGGRVCVNKGEALDRGRSTKRGVGMEGGIPLPMLKKIEIRDFRCLLKHSKFHISMCIFHTKRANIWHPMKPDLCCDASDGDCYSVNLFDDHDY